jgi:hypothetical protein
MRKIDYEARVKVQIMHKFPTGADWREIHMWDGIGFADAVRRVQALPLKEQIGAMIFAPIGVFGIEAIHEIYERPDFPGF